MTRAYFFYQGDTPAGFLVEDHAGFAAAGKDIVCSSISTAVFTSINLIKSILNPTAYRMLQDEDKGLIQFEVLERHEFVNLVIINLREVLVGIADDYPKSLKVFKKPIDGRWR